MSDFAQHGLICTLQRLKNSHEAEIETALTALASRHPIALVLPCSGEDFARPALRHILDELSGAQFLSEIVVSMNGIDAARCQHAVQLLRRLPQRTRVIWNDGPRLSEIFRSASLSGEGKGRNVWSAFGLLTAEANAATIATQDCDVMSFRRGTLARLCYAISSPELGYDFAKMYYSRVAERIYGRVSRLFLAPFLQALLRVAGHHPLLDFLLSFRYPLSGECALTRALAGSASVSPGWDLEVGLQCEVFRLTPARKICQVDGGSDYDHKHQPLVDADGGGLVAMTEAIARTLLRELDKEGVAIDAPFLDALRTAHLRESEEALRRSKHLALINGLAFDESSERRIAESFALSMDEAVLRRADEPPKALPAWDRLRASDPDFVCQFREAVAADNR